MVQPTLQRVLESEFARYRTFSREKVALSERHRDSATNPSGQVSPALAPHYGVQEIVRPMFGKGPSKTPSIGDHPDFQHLKQTDKHEFCAITTLFMDIESSTRLGILYEPKDVFEIKNAVIRMAMDIVRSFDGHVHRIMGDSVMAFFGGRSIVAEQGAIDAINCAAVLRLFSQVVVAPYLAQNGITDPVGIRTGIDFGPSEKVLWKSYGYPGMEEVTATSFFVDVAAKLQHSAGRNQIAMGQSLRELLDFPDELLDTKTSIKDGERQRDPYIQPNHTNRDGKPINYRMFLLNWEQYLACTRIAQLEQHLVDSKRHGATGLQVEATIFREQTDPLPICPYHPCGSHVAKNRSIRFRAKLQHQPHLPFTVRFSVENHGQEARTQGGESLGNHHTDYSITKTGVLQFTHSEPTAFRGLHYLNVEILNSGALQERVRFGVYVE